MINLEMAVRNKLNLVLLVDDDAVSNFITEKFLRNSGLIESLEVMINGKQASDFFHDCPSYPDLILLDINMPLMNGFEFLEFLERKGLSGKSKVAILTSSVRKEDRENALRFNDVIGYIEKPISKEKIIHLLNEIT